MAKRKIFSFPQKSDEVLIRLYFEGDNACLLELLDRYIRVIDQKMLMYPHIKSEREDIKQEALISVMSAVKQFKLDHGVQFRTYASRCIDNSIKNSLSKLNTRKAKMLFSAVSIEDAGDTSGLSERLSVQNDPEQLYIDNEKYQRLLTIIDATLSDFEKEVLFLYVDGNSYTVIANSLDCSLKTVDNALQRVRKKIKAYF